MDIDEKLREILLSRTLGQYAADGEGNLVPVNWEDSPVIDQYVGEIKQAFAENTEVSLTMAGIRNFRDGDGNEFMTGSEFYERFVFEYKHKVSYGLEYAHTKDALEAARHAAGLDT